MLDTFDLLLDSLTARFADQAVTAADRGNLERATAYIEAAGAVREVIIELLQFQPIPLKACALSDDTTDTGPALPESI